MFQITQLMGIYWGTTIFVIVFVYFWKKIKEDGGRLITNSALYQSNVGYIKLLWYNICLVSLPIYILFGSLKSILSDSSQLLDHYWLENVMKSLSRKLQIVGNQTPTESCTCQGVYLWGQQKQQVKNSSRHHERHGIIRVPFQFI